MLFLFGITLQGVPPATDADVVPAGSGKSKDFSWLQENIRDEHPRFFLDVRSLEAAKARALGREADPYAHLRTELDALIQQKHDMPASALLDPASAEGHDYGYRAAEAAFVYLVSGDVKYLEFAKKLLTALPEYYRQRTKVAPSINWYASSRIHALCALDWLYPHLTPAERAQLGGDLFSAFKLMLEDESLMVKIPGRNVSNSLTDGFYGDNSLYWYAGLAFHRLGFDDVLAKKWLKRGFDDHLRLLEYRKGVSADQGGAATSAIGYAIVTYPMAEFQFFHTVESATGYDASADWMHQVDALYYFYWNLLPGWREFGYGDASHFTNRLINHRGYNYFEQMAHFYADKRPEAVPMMRFLMNQVERPQQPLVLYPLMRFILRGLPEDDQMASVSQPPLEDHPPSMFFANMGQVFMRSGFGDTDTYASFTAGGILSQHRHFDNNNFVIYKNAFLALDSGTRPEPGQHLSHYYARTVAHNSILIRMPDEVFPAYWGRPAEGETPLPVPNDGGQRDKLGSEVVAYAHNDDYVYIASDATKSYHADKAKMVLRQFVFVMPDIFVVFDKVESADKSYPKTWLLHMATEPQITGDTFCVRFGDGVLFSRTMFPEQAVLTKIGGPGKQFWSDGRNWPLPVVKGSKSRDRSPLLGQWRMEVSPRDENHEDYFLHLIEVGGADLEAMVDSTAITEIDSLGVEFSYNGNFYRIIFKTGATHGGHITVKRDGKVVRSEPFATSVLKQRSPFFRP